MGVIKPPRHEIFAQELAKGKTQVEAYEIAGYVPLDSNAAKLANNPKIIARVSEITGKGAARAEVTVASIIAELEQARELAMNIKQPAPAISASMGKAKISGLDIVRTEITGKNGGAIETKDLTERPSELEIARRIAFVLEKGARADRKGD